MKRKPVYVTQIDSTGYILSRCLPRQCVRECSGPGYRGEHVSAWIERLDFDAPEEGARKYLRACGLSCERESHQLILERLLWVIAGDDRSFMVRTREKRHLMANFFL